MAGEAYQSTTAFTDCAAKYRYYNPSTMRWLKRDPLGMVDGPNMYAYVRGNVVQSIDLLGLWSAGFPGLVLAGMGLGCLTGAVSGATSCLGAPRKECVSKILCGCVGGGVSGAIESILAGKLGNRILESIGINPLSSLLGSVGGFVSCVCDTVSSKGTKALRDKDTFKCCTGAALGGGISGLGLGTAARARGNQHSFKYGQLAGAVGSSVGGITGGAPGKFACCGLDSFL